MKAKEMSMPKKMSKSSSVPSSANANLPIEAKANGKKTGKALTKKRVLTRKEKLEAAKKANQAMMRAWKLISQRKNSDTDVESNV
jgi:Cu2+-containing amine oxidase